MRQRTLWSHIKAAAPLVLIASGATFLIQQFGWLDGLETTNLDFMLRLREPVKPQYVWIVGIDNKDYEDLFRNHSPMDAETLRKLIGAVAALKPRVVGVDIDTTDSKGACPADTGNV